MEQNYVCEGMKRVMRKQLEELRKAMSENEVDAYIIVSDDFHGSEYVGDYFKCREYISGFDGSAGTLVVTKNEAGLWTDGRYFLQGEEQLAGSGIKLRKMGQPGVPTITAYLAEKLQDGQCIAYDGRTLTVKYAEMIKKELSDKKLIFKENIDLVGAVWKDRPAMSAEPIWILDDQYAGCARTKKLAQLRLELNQCNADAILISALDEICWLYNIRGNDIAYNPVALAYTIVTQKHAALYVQMSALPDSVQSELEADGVVIKEYFQIYNDLRDLSAYQMKQLNDTFMNCVHIENACAEKSYLEDNCAEIQHPRNIRSCTILLDPASVNTALAAEIDISWRIKYIESPVKKAKSIKNPIEMENEVQAHIMDGVAVTKLIYWLKQNLNRETKTCAGAKGEIEKKAEIKKKEEIEKNDEIEYVNETCRLERLTELDICRKLEELRKQAADYLGPSFAPIAGSGPHGAIIHYEPTVDSNIEIVDNSFILLDTGGHYLRGTTDITRTIACGNLTQEQKQHYTAVLCGNLNLGAVYFKYGCTGANFDYLARASLWQLGLDYNHGTGHGVGYLLNVHEGPNGIRLKNSDNSIGTIFEEGMITSNEPGVYLENQYGIRLENLLICVKDKKTEYGQFMRMETLTMVPFDRDAIDPELLGSREKKLLNDYHQMVYEKIGPLLQQDEREWLRKETEKIR